MRSFGIVPDEPVEHIEVESMDIDHFSLVIVDIFFLDRTIEPFTVGVHLRGLGIRMPVREAETTELFVEMPHELRPVVREDVLKAIREQDTDNLEEISSCL
jgi:hypothetical protein